MVVCEQQCVARVSFITVISPAAATELSGLLGESPRKYTQGRSILSTATASCQQSVSSQLRTDACGFV